MLKYLILSGITFALSSSILAFPQLANTKNIDLKRVTFVNCANSHLPIFSCLKNSLFIDKFTTDTDFEIVRFDSQADCIGRISKLRDHFKNAAKDNDLLNNTVMVMSGLEMLIDFRLDQLNLKETKKELKEAEINLKKTTVHHEKSYIDSVLFKNYSTEITKNLAPLKNELVRYRLALDSIANFLEAQDLASHKKTIDNFRNRAARVTDIIKEIENPGQFVIQAHGDSKIDIKKFDSLQSELNEIKNLNIEELQTVRLNASKRINLKELEYKGEIAKLKAQLKQERFTMARNCSANLLFMLVAFWQDNYEDQILPRILKSSSELVIAKDEYIVLNTIEPKEYCTQVMQNSSLQKVVERRLSLGESLIQELQKK